MATDTRQRLLDAALETIRTVGIVGVSARTVATAAGVNQALVFYHFGSVDELLNQACLVSSEARVAHYRDRFAAITSLRGLLDVGRRLHQEERALGNVTVLAQMLAGAQSDKKLAESTARALALWVAEIEAVLRRLLAPTPIAELADPGGLARAVSAAFIGLELFDGVDRPGANDALDALERLATLIEVMDDLGPIARRAVKAKLRRAGGAT